MAMRSPLGWRFAWVLASWLAFTGGGGLGAQGFAPPVPALPPGVDGAIRTTFYDVHGRTVREVAASLRREGPAADGAADAGAVRTAFTDSKLSWRYAPRPDGASCRATGVRVTISAEVLMPRWTPPSDAEPGLEGAWAQSMRALAAHEAGHAAILVTYASRIHARLTRLRAACDTFTQRANAEGNALAAEMRAAQQKYDADTRHGLTQGTGFPPPRDSSGSPAAPAAAQSRKRNLDPR